MQKLTPNFALLIFNFTFLFGGVAQLESERLSCKQFDASSNLAFASKKFHCARMEQSRLGGLISRKSAG